MSNCSHCKSPQACRNGCVAEVTRGIYGQKSKVREIPVTSNKKKTTISGMPNAELLRKTNF
jgi:hypothetical protein